MLETVQFNIYKDFQQVFSTIFINFVIVVFVVVVAFVVFCFCMRLLLPSLRVDATERLKLNASSVADQRAVEPSWDISK